MVVVYEYDARECGTCFVSILLRPRRAAKASVCASVLTTWSHKCSCCFTRVSRLLRGCQLLDPFCCPTPFTHAKAVFSASRQAFSIMFQGPLTFLGQTCCRCACRAESCIDRILRVEKKKCKGYKRRHTSA